MMRLHHVNVVVPPGRGDVAIPFYAQVLGLKQVVKPSEGVSSTGVWFDVPGGTQVHVSERAGDRHADQHFALVVEEYDAVVSRIAASAPWREGAVVLGARRGVTADPFGNAVEIIEAAGTFA